MEKIININLGNYTITIEEPAYLLLQGYLENLKIHFIKTEGQQDIINDIESRMGELLYQKISVSHPAINTNDIEEIISIMGEPVDMGAEEKKESRQNFNSYRRTRRIFRDPDHRKVGGVCAGIGAYFGLDPLWLRLVFVFSLLFLGGGLLLYIILWIVIPEAQTTSEKLEMHGEPVDINSISQKIKDNFGQMENEIKGFYSHRRRDYQHKYKGKFREHTHQTIGTLTYLMARFIGGFITFLGLLLIILWTKFYFFTPALGIPQLMGQIFINSWEKDFVQILLYLLILIPLTGISINGIRLLFNIKYKNRTLKYGMHVINICIVLSFIYLAVISFSKFEVSGSLVEPIKIQADSLKQVKIYFDRDDFFEQRNSIFRINQKYFLLYNPEEGYRAGTIQFSIKRGLGDSAYLELRKTSYGENIQEARKYARTLSQDIHRADNGLIIPNYFNIPQNTPWRAQETELMLFLPVDYIIDFSNLPDNIKYISDFVNNTDESLFDTHEAGRWMMTTKGLKAL